MAVNVLGIDLGTNTGWAIRSYDHPPVFGTWKLATADEITRQRRVGDDRNQDIRVIRLHSYVREYLAGYYIQKIVFEDVRFIKSVMQGQLWAALRSALWLQDCRAPGGGLLRIEAVPVQTLKKFATGFHNASKEQMIEAARKKFNLGAQKFDDNAADALHLMDYGYHNSKS